MAQKNLKFMPPKEEHHPTAADEEFDKFEHVNAASFSECTGLMPRPPENAEEAAAYMDIFDYGPTTEEEEIHVR